MAKQWRTIGEVCVDSGSIVICDPCRADKASDWWQGVATGEWPLGNYKHEAELKGENGDPLAVALHTGIGDGWYAVEARYEQHPFMGKRVAEIRIRFLPHPQLEMGDDDLAEMVPKGAA